MTEATSFIARVENTENLLTDIADTTNSYYLSIGKADAWSDTATDFTDDILISDLTNGPIKSQTYEAQTRQNMLALKRIVASRSSHGIRKYVWTSGNNYTPWDSNDPDIHTKLFYVLTSEKKVYKCLKAGPSSSTVQPTQVNDAPTTESDGYMWKFMYTLSAIQSDFETPSYMPVKTVKLGDGQVVADLSTEDQIKYTTQQNAENYKGKIYIIKVTNGGSGYSSATVNIDGDGTGATATATITGNTVSSITVTAEGDNYNVAKVTITGDGTGAKAYAVLSPPNGHGSDPVRELGGKFAIMFTEISGDENGDFPIDEDFRQVCLLKNVTNFGTSTIATADTLNAIKFMELSGVTNGGDFLNSNQGDLITGASSGAQAFVVAYDIATGYIGIIQNEKTGYLDFNIGETINGINGGQGTIANLAVQEPEVDIHSGTLLITNNIQAVNRTEAGREKMRWIVEL